VDLTPTGSVDSGLCQPLYGRDKAVGIAIRVEDAAGDYITSLEGYEFEIRTADGTVLEVPIGEGTAPDQPVNVSADTATDLLDEYNGLPSVFDPDGIFYLNCSPGSGNEAFPEGTVFVAIRDGEDVSSGSLAGSFAPLWSAVGDAGPAVDARLQSLLEGLCATDADIPSIWEQFIEPIGLAVTPQITSFVSLNTLNGNPHDCEEESYASLLLWAYLQATFRDAPLGLLGSVSDPITVLPTDAPPIPFAAMGYTGPIVLESLSDELPRTGSVDVWLLPALALAMTATGGAVRRRARH
jgi:hypothetical protein